MPYLVIFAIYVCNIDYFLIQFFEETDTASLASSEETPLLKRLEAVKVLQLSTELRVWVMGMRKVLS